MIVFKVTLYKLCFAFVKMSGLCSLSPTRVKCSSAFRPQWPPLPPAAFQLSLASVSSPRSLSFCKTEVLGLDDGVPIKVILDVISWHAMHLEVSGRYHVLLVHLCMVSWEGNGGK